MLVVSSQMTDVAKQDAEAMYSSSGYATDVAHGKVCTEAVYVCATGDQSCLIFVMQSGKYSNHGMHCGRCQHVLQLVSAPIYFVGHAVPYSAEIHSFSNS